MKDLTLNIALQLMTPKQRRGLYTKAKVLKIINDNVGKPAFEIQAILRSEIGVSESLAQKLWLQIKDVKPDMEVKDNVGVISYYFKGNEILTGCRLIKVEQIDDKKSKYICVAPYRSVHIGKSFIAKDNQLQKVDGLPIDCIFSEIIKYI